MISKRCATANGVRLTSVVAEGGSSWTAGSDQEEAVLVLLRGSVHCALDAGAGGSRMLQRRDPFDAPSTGLYLPAGAHVTCEAGGDGAEAVLASVPAGAGTQPCWLEPAIRERRGRGSWTREVGSIVAPPVSARVVVGETVARDGAWSTFPPHKHDLSDPPRQTAMQEAFCFRVRPPSGFGVLVSYTDGVADAHTRVITDGSMAEINDGYHTIAVAGEHDLYYLWAAAGQDNEIIFHTDPGFAWVLQGHQ